MPPATPLLRGRTAGTCVSAGMEACAASLIEELPGSVAPRLPRGEEPAFALAKCAISGDAAIVDTKDAGDEPDVTHGAALLRKAPLRHVSPPPLAPPRNRRW